METLSQNSFQKFNDPSSLFSDPSFILDVEVPFFFLFLCSFQLLIPPSLFQVSDKTEACDLEFSEEAESRLKMPLDCPWLTECNGGGKRGCYRMLQS